MQEQKLYEMIPAKKFSLDYFNMKKNLLLKRKIFFAPSSPREWARSVRPREKSNFKK